MVQFSTVFKYICAVSWLEATDLDQTLEVTNTEHRLNILCSVTSYEQYRDTLMYLEV